MAEIVSVTLSNPFQIEDACNDLVVIGDDGDIDDDDEIWFIESSIIEEYERNKADADGVTDHDAIVSEVEMDGTSLAWIDWNGNAKKNMFVECGFTRTCTDAYSIWSQTLTVLKSS